MADVAIRRALPADLRALTRIYNHYVEKTPITFDVELYTVESRRPWLEKFAERGRYQLFVAEAAGEVLGYAGTTRFRDKAAYDPSVEPTVYLAPDSTGRGIGTLLYARLFEALRGEDAHRAYAGITVAPNPASVALHERFGFRRVGLLREVGRKFGRFWDVEWFEKEL